MCFFLEKYFPFSMILNQVQIITSFRYLKKKKSNNFERNFVSTNFLSKKVQGNAKMFLLIPAGIEIRQINSPFPPPLKLLLRLLVFFIFRFLLFVTFAAPNCIYFIHENKISLPFHFSLQCFFTVDVKSEEKKYFCFTFVFFLIHYILVQIYISNFFK